MAGALNPGLEKGQAKFNAPLRGAKAPSTRRRRFSQSSRRIMELTEVQPDRVMPFQQIFTIQMELTRNSDYYQ